MGRIIFLVILLAFVICAVYTWVTWLRENGLAKKDDNSRIMEEKDKVIKEKDEQIEALEGKIASLKEMYDKENIS